MIGEIKDGRWHAIMTVPQFLDLGIPMQCEERFGISREYRLDGQWLSFKPGARIELVFHSTRPRTIEVTISPSGAGETK